MTKVNILTLTACIFLLFGCEYEDFIHEEYDYTTAYFAHETINRTIVVEEFSEIGVGVMLGGKMHNKTEEWATYKLDTSILEDNHQVLPEDYYTIEGVSNDTTFVIPAGKYLGFVHVKIDTAKFLNDPLALTGKYALGFTLTGTSLDSILENQASTIITFKYASPYFGHYYHHGSVISYDDANQPVDTTTYDYKQVWDMLTFDQNTVVTNGLGNLINDKDSKIKLKVDNGHVKIFTVPGSKEVVDEGGSTYNAEDRTFILNYSFEKNGSKRVAKDTLVFRNRILDGVNQWLE